MHQNDNRAALTPIDDQDLDQVAGGWGLTFQRTSFQNTSQHGLVNVSVLDGNNIALLGGTNIVGNNFA